MNGEKASKSASSSSRPKGEAGFRIQGRVELKGLEAAGEDMQIKAYAFRPGGDFLAAGEVNNEGSFNLPLKLRQPEDVEIFVGPEVDDPQAIRRSSAFAEHFSAQQWVADGNQFRLRPEFIIPPHIWWPWRPVRICISGHVRKVETDGMHTEYCPVPFVKVEVFDVDRERCLWPFITGKITDLLDRPVIRIPDLIKNPPIPRPEPPPFHSDMAITPIPIPEMGRLGLLDEVALNPQPLPPAEISARITAADLQGASGLVGEAASLNPRLAERLSQLTFTSRIAPWIIFPGCFYSRALVCETTTDCEGYFRCCFRWLPFHFRRGRLRFDMRPDIILRVTQVIDGTPTIIYMDPYTGTRWNSGNAHIDLFLDNEEVVCGSPSCDPQPEGSAVFFTRVGNDEVYRINQTNGLYTEGALSNVAYGTNLDIYAQFGDNLTTGAPARYYRLSYAKKTNPAVTPADSDFIPVPIGVLEDTRVTKMGLVSDTYKLGPKPVGTQTGLYEVRNFTDYYWYNPDWIGTWATALAEEDTGLYVLRLEVFDENGNKLNTASGLVDYRDGTVAPPAVLPPMTDHCDLVITLDNQAPVIDLQVPTTNDCGVIPYSPGMVLNFGVSAVQPNNRLHTVGLEYTKGVLPTINHLYPHAPAAYPHTSNTGLPGSIVTTVSGADLLTGLTSTCAFALKLHATAHIRNGRHFVYYREQIKAIAIEKCS